MTIHPKSGMRCTPFEDGSYECVPFYTDAQLIGFGILLLIIIGFFYYLYKNI